MRISPLWLMAAPLLFTSPVLWAAEPYFGPERVPPTTIEPPPEAQSGEWKADIDSIATLQENASADEVAQARTERTMEPEMVALAADPLLTRENFPATYALLDRVGATSKAVTGAAKRYWNTKRPYLADERIKSLIEPHDNPAYPSGHTAGAYVWAATLAKLLPSQEAALLARAESIAQHRVLVGMHFPHDVEGGKALARAMMQELENDPAYQQDMLEAAAEIAKAAGAQP